MLILNLPKVVLIRITAATYLTFLLSLVLTLTTGCDSDYQKENSKSETPSSIGCSKCPKLTSEMDTLDFVSDVRRFVRKTVDTGALENYSDDELQTAWANNDLDRVIEIFEHDSGLVEEYFTTKLMVQILLNAGLDAYEFSFGFRDLRETHSVALFKYQDKMFIHNPEHNYVMLNEDGSYLDLFSLIMQIGSGDLKWKLSTDTVFSHLILGKKLLDSNEQIRQALTNSTCLDYFGDEVESRNSILKYRVPFCYECTKSRPCAENGIERFEKQLTKLTGLSNFHEGFILHPEIGLGADDRLEVMDKIETSIYSQSVLGKRVNARRYGK